MTAINWAANVGLGSASSQIVKAFAVIDVYYDFQLLIFINKIILKIYLNSESKFLYNIHLISYYK